MKIISLKKQWKNITIGVLSFALFASTIWAITANNVQDGSVDSNTAAVSSEDPQAQLEEHGITPLDTTLASNKQSTTDELLYLIEEEKLAHDVYQVLYDKWGSNVFVNIKDSETKHQSLVLGVLKSRGIVDPRTEVIGQFVNQDLQKLYDSLIAQGMQSQLEAYKVGVVIEETDIADIKDTLANLDPKDTDVKDVLDNLLHGSENHLRAFNRQVSR